MDCSFPHTKDQFTDILSFADLSNKYAVLLYQFKYSLKGQEFNNIEFPDTNYNGSNHY